MPKYLKIIFFVVISLIIILIFLNPNTASFKNYARDLGDPSYIIYKREANYFLFSVFIKQGYGKTQEYYGFAGNFFEVKNNPPTQRYEGLVSKDSVTAIADSATKEAADTVLNYGPNAHIWMDSLGTYIEKNPNASDKEIYKKFPQLDNNEKKLIVGVAYDQIKREKGITEYKLRSRFPELFRDELYYQWHK